MSPRQDPETPESVLTRFSIVTLEEDFNDFTVVASMPVGGMLNPFTGMPTIGALAILVDDVAGRANFHRRGSGQWTVSSELTVELSPDGIDSILAAPDEPVVASGSPLGPHGATLLAIATLTHRGTTIGGGTVRTVAITGGPDGPLPRGQDGLVRTPQTSLVELMSAEARQPQDGTLPAGAAAGHDHQQPDRHRARRGQQHRAGTGGLRRDQPRASRTAADGIDPGELPAARSSPASDPATRERWCGWAATPRSVTHRLWATTARSPSWPASRDTGEQHERRLRGAVRQRTRTGDPARLGA